MISPAGSRYPLPSNDGNHCGSSLHWRLLGRMLCSPSPSNGVHPGGQKPVPNCVHVAPTVEVQFCIGWGGISIVSIRRHVRCTRKEVPSTYSMKHFNQYHLTSQCRHLCEARHEDAAAYARGLGIATEGARARVSNESTPLDVELRLIIKKPVLLTHSCRSVPTTCYRPCASSGFPSNARLFTGIYYCILRQ